MAGIHKDWISVGHLNCTAAVALHIQPQRPKSLKDVPLAFLLLVMLTVLLSAPPSCRSRFLDLLSSPLLLLLLPLLLLLLLLLLLPNSSILSLSFRLTPRLTKN